jgi:hypothetical protein
MSPAGDSLLPFLRDAIDNGAFVKLVLSKYRGDEADLKRLDIRLVELQGGQHLTFVYKYATCDITKNLHVVDGVAEVSRLLGSHFRAGYLFAKESEVEVLFNRKGKGRIFHRKGQPRVAQSTDHNRAKHRLLDPATPFLKELGITNEKGAVLPSMADKWKQINRFLEIFAAAFDGSALASRKRVRVVDFGAGKGYLTFAVHHYLTSLRGLEATVVGVELRPHLVKLCNKASQRLSLVGLEMSEGDVEHFPLGETDILIALHACDTATDLALYSGIQAGAQLLLASPCCHKQIRPQIKPPEVLLPMLRHGIHLEKEAEMVTDALRALLLEEAGFKAQIMEFISAEHTDKNKLLMATKRMGTAPTGKVRAQIDSLKSFYGISEQALEMLLSR